MFDIACYNDHAVALYEKGQYNLALEVFVAAIRVVLLEMTENAFKYEEIHASILQAEEIFAKTSNLATLYDGDKSAQYRLRSRHETSLIQSLVHSTPIKMRSMSSSYENDINCVNVSQHQTAILFFNAALLNQQCSFEQNHQEDCISIKNALRLYKMSFDIVAMHYATSASHYRMLDESQLIVMACLNNTSLIHYDNLRYDLSRGCMEHLSSFIQSTVANGTREDFFLLNIETLHATVGAPVA